MIFFPLFLLQRGQDGLTNGSVIRVETAAHREVDSEYAPFLDALDVNNLKAIEYTRIHGLAGHARELPEVGKGDISHVHARKHGEAKLITLGVKAYCFDAGS
jgi:hypothetical protein